ncbi:MAG: ABC transporter ATP-binding protein [Acidobacteria bacterium]|nr:ABC transporter ATP-binding protein [Acidobacteriota bacterium]
MSSPHRAGAAAPAAPAVPVSRHRDELVVFENVSKFYGETLGVNRVTLAIPPGITGLVGPNGAGKSTLMGLMTGLLRPSAGSVTVLGISPAHPEQLFRRVGFCTQQDAFPPGATGRSFLVSFLSLAGRGTAWAKERAAEMLDQVGLREAADRRAAGYSKGMRQRLRLGLALAADPQVLILDEPLNGLDPLARAEVIALLQEQARSGRHVILSSHILHEVDLLSDQVVLLNEGYVVAEGNIQAVRGEMHRHPLQVLIRCDAPQRLATRLMGLDGVVEVKLHPDKGGFFVRTEDADSFFYALNGIVLESGARIDAVAPADDDVQSVYQYLIQNGGRGAA